MSRKVTFAKNKIRKLLYIAKQFVPLIYEKPFKDIKADKIFCNHTYSYNLLSLKDIENKYSNLEEIYNNNGGKLISLERGVTRTLKNYLDFNINNVKFDDSNTLIISGVNIKNINSKKTNNKNKKPKKLTIEKQRRKKERYSRRGTFIGKCKFIGSAHKFSKDYFDNFCKTFVEVKGSKKNKNIKAFCLKNGVVLNTYSKEERSFLRRLEKQKNIRDIRGGSISLCIPPNNFYDKSYYPDYVFQTYEGIIGIIEVKELKEFCDKDVINKWKGLQSYCQEKGFICYICNRFFQSYKELQKIKMDPEFKKEINSKIYHNNAFTYYDFAEFKKKSLIKKEKLENMLSAFCCRKKKGLVYEGRYFKYREFRIIKESIHYHSN